MNECRRMDVVIIGRKDSHQADHFDEVPTGYPVHSDFVYSWSTQSIFWSDLQLLFFQVDVFRLR